MEDFCSLAQYYAQKTPQSFRRVSNLLKEQTKKSCFPCTFPSAFSSKIDSSSAFRCSLLVFLEGHYLVANFETLRSLLMADWACKKSSINQLVLTYKIFFSQTLTLKTVKGHPDFLSCFFLVFFFILEIKETKKCFNLLV